jgi:IS30 family transposase
MKKKNKKRKKFRHLKQTDRDRIEALLDAGHLQEEIAKILKVDAGTISREIKNRKRKNGHYEATTAQHKASVKRSNSKSQGMKIEKYPELRQHIINELKAKRSPNEIAGRLKRKKIVPRVNSNSIYKWLYSIWGQAYCKYLCTKRYKRKKQTKKVKREMIPNRISLEKRPRKGIHAEGDLFVSPTKTGTSRSGAIICIPETKLIAGIMIEDKKPTTMTRAVKKIVSGISIDDLTLDNGIENRDHEQFGMNTYFADPHAPWQKPHIENSIGLLRKWFIPKKTDLKNVSENQLQKYLHILNGKFRKSLGYRSAYEVSMERGIIQKTLATSEVGR